jgi:lysophospholipase L1-like esterase
MVNIISDYIPMFGSLPNIAPFTYKDGETYLSTLEALRAYVNTTVVNFVNDNFALLNDSTTVEINALIGTVNAAIGADSTSIATQLSTQNTTVTNQLAAQNTSATAQITTLTNYVNTQVQSIVNNSITAQDSVVTALVSDTTKNTNPALITLIKANTDKPKVYRSTFARLPVFSRKRQLVRLNNAPARIMCIGDSTTTGVFSDSLSAAPGTTNQGGPQSYPAQLANRFNSLGLKSDYSLAIPGHSGNDDSRWAMGGWAYTGSFGLGMNSCLTAASANLTMTLIPGIIADRYVVYYFGDSGTGVFSVSATGGTSQSINSNNTIGNVYSSPVINAAVASTSNVVSFNNVSGGNFVMGVESWNSADPNKVRIFNAGVGASRATDWANGQNAGPLSTIKAIAPDLTIISLGVNDGAVPNSVATVFTAVQAVAAAAAISGDVMLLSAIPHNAPGVLDGYNTAYLTSNYPYLDLQGRWGYAALANGFMINDNTHPNGVGYGDIATFIANSLNNI